MQSEEFWGKIREAIEKRLDELDLGSIIIGNCQQTVPIIKDKLTVTYRSPHRKEFAEIRRLSKMEGENRLDVDKLALLDQALGIVQINDMVFKPVRRGDEILTDNILENAKQLSELDDILMLYVVQNNGWFRDRVATFLKDKILSDGGADALKNGSGLPKE